MIDYIGEIQMFILGDLIRLDPKDERLPLPWWQRAPLAFQSKTDVFVALTQSKEDRPGDIIVSVLNPSHWGKMFRIKCQYEEGPGVISRAFSLAGDWNIALAETMTADGGRTHQLELICEPADGSKATPNLRVLQREFVEGGFLHVQVEFLRSPTLPLIWCRQARVQNGWVTRPKGATTWREELSRQLTGIGKDKSFDLNHVVVSCDTQNRLLRYVIPRRGARTVTIDHADEPGTLNKLTTALASEGLNILSFLLKRGGVPRDDAVLVAVCEPVGDDPNPLDVRLDAALEQRIRALPPELRAEPKTNRGRSAESVLYPRNPEEIVMRVPEVLKPRVVAVQKAVPNPKKTVFLSQRFYGERCERYGRAVRDALKEFGYEVLQARPRPGVTETSFDEVCATMWAAWGGVVLVAEPEGSSEASFNLNLAHEFGFLQGQGKPLLLLAENESKALADLDRWTNAKGIVAPRFGRETALARNHPDSIFSKIRQWLLDVERVEWAPGGHGAVVNDSTGVTSFDRHEGLGIS